MQSLNIHELQKLATKTNQRYLEFLRFPSMSMGLYRLAAGQADPQSPHKQDEVYYVVEGQAKLQVGDKLHAAVAGSILFVKAEEPHKFIDIEEDLSVLVFFAPAEQD